ncbi:hypothetical protein ACKI1S_47750, partial [Streptomyces galilaeus]
KITLGSGPIFEQVAQPHEDNYERKARRECGLYIELLQQLFGESPKNVSYKTDIVHVDGVRKYAVCLEYDPTDDIAVDYCAKIQNKEPNTWNG